MSGVGTYALELFRRRRRLDAVYVPIGMGSGICGLIAARDALGLRTEIVGVVSPRRRRGAVLRGRASGADEFARTFADGMACRVPDARPSRSSAGAARIVRVSEDEIAAACAPISDTHNLAEGAGAARSPR